MSSAEKIVKQADLNIKKLTDPDALAHEALNIFVDNANKCVKAKGVFYVAISGGHTPEKFYEFVADYSQNHDFPWDKTQVFWVDERFVPPEADASNYGLAANAFLQKVPIPADNVHRMSGEAPNYNVAVSEYERVLKNTFQLGQGEVPHFDLMYLGMGSDGHVGSLLPGSYAAMDADDLVTAVYLMDNNYSRITLTAPVICAARKIVVLVSGSEKAQIVKDVLTGEPDEVKYPVHCLWPKLDKVIWLLDEDAASLLEV